MENASKALLIAAAVLVTIIIITVGIKIYTSTGDTQKVALSTGDTISTKTDDATDLATYEITGYKTATEKNVAREIKNAYEESSGNIADMQNKLQKIFNDNTIKVEDKNDKIKVTINVDSNPKQYIYNINDDKVSEYVDPINYGGKSKATIQPGDDITIGTEKFMVFSKTATEIKAMPYYNITLTTDNPVQSTSAGRTRFSTTNYWTMGEDTIDMSDSRNNIQQYIIAYKTTLEGLGAEGIQVRAAKYSELTAEGVTVSTINPGQTDSFWLGSSWYASKYDVWQVSSTGSTYKTYESFSWYGGVRPIIIIPM